MNSDQYQTIQEAFLRIREFSEHERASHLSLFREQHAELADTLAELLANDVQDDDAFLQRSLIQLVDQDRTITQMRTPEQTDPHPSRIGPYRILQKIGEGGHGVVFMAEQLQPIRRKVAIKWVKQGMDSKSILARFEAERQALAMMNHPSIANVIDAGTTDGGQPYFVMELVHGIPIDQFCFDNALNLDERLGLLRQVCDAVHHAHRKGIIHRDLKPANVLVTVESGRPLAKVIDFGIAKALHMPLTEKTMFTEYGQIIGTLEYMSPEQAMMTESGTDVRSDVYSLGVLLYLLLTGETPISKSELLKEGIWQLKQVLQNHRPATPSLRMSGKSAPQLWRDHDPETSRWPGKLKGDLDWITMKALAKEPDLRYDSASQLSEDLRNYLNGDTIAARPPGWRYSLRQFVRRHRIAAAVGGALAAGLLVALFGFGWGYWKSQTSLQVANLAKQESQEKSEQLQTALTETERQRQRADEQAARLATLVERSIVESAWEQALNGDWQRSKATLNDLPEWQRGLEWNFVHEVGKWNNRPALRHGSAGTIRLVGFHKPLDLVAIVTHSGHLEVFDGLGQQKLRLPIPPLVYSTLDFSTNGQQLMLGGPNDRVHLYDLVGQSKTKTTRIGKGGIRSVVHDPKNSRWLITTGANFLISVSEETLQVQTEKRLPTRIDHVAIADDGQSTVVTGQQGDWFLFGDSSLAEFQRLKGSSSGVQVLKYIGNQFIGVDTVGNRLQLLVDEDPKVEFSWSSDLSATDWSAMVVDIDESGGLVFGDRSGRLFAIAKDSERQIPIWKFSKAIKIVTQMPQSKQWLAVHTTGRISRISDEDFRCRRAYVPQLDKLADAATYDPFDFVLAADSDGNIQSWDIKTGEIVQQAKLHQGEVLGLAVHAASNRLASQATDWQLVIADLKNLKAEHTLPVGLGVRRLAFSKDGKWLAAAPDPKNKTDLREGTIDIWDPENGKASKRLVGHTNWVTHLQFTNDDQWLVSQSVDGTVRVWDVAEARCLRSIDTATYAATTAFCLVERADQIHLALGHQDGLVSTWDLKSGRRCAERHLFDDAVSGIVFPRQRMTEQLGDDNRLFAASRNSPIMISVGLSDLAIKFQFDVGAGNIHALKLTQSASSDRLQVLGKDNAIRIWPIHSTSRQTK